MGTNSQAIVSASLNGKSLGVFDTRSGGESTAAVSKYRPGGSKNPVVDAGRPDTADVTITRRWDQQRDIDVVRTLRAAIGRGILKVTEQPTDVDGLAFGKPSTWSGRVSSVTGGDADSNSDDVRMISVTMVAVGVV
ncbi:MAG: hypothetical protein ACTMIY_03080 [Microbacterium gubbeenense]